MTEKQKLELTWIGKNNEIRLEPRILIEDPEKSYGDKNTENMLIHGDNLLALKALEQDFIGKVKCICIDPPYNTGSAFEHYEDGLEHSIWLNLMKQRILHIYNLLSADGVLWITIDDNESHYLKVLCDEIFGRKNFVANIVWEKMYSVRMDSRSFSVDHDHILVYQKSDKFAVNKLKVEQSDKQFSLFDELKGKYYRRRSLRKEGANSLRTDRPNLFYALTTPDGSELFPIKPDGIEGYWRWSKDTLKKELEKDSSILEWIKKDAKWQVYVKQYKEDNAVRPPSTVWISADCGHNHESKEEVKLINNQDVFSTPKPERLIKRILEISTSLGDLVLDSFLGSGTTAAVAHKMNRKYIGIELGDHCYTHCLKRLQMVVDGEQGGISKSVNWQGGGGFKFYELAPSLLKKDSYGNWIIDDTYNADMLAQAMAKHEGFKYKPDENIYWKHGQSTEKDYIFTTTNFITVEYLDILHEEMKPGESLLICAKSFQEACKDRYENITIKKIPRLLLGKCEFGRDDYSLNILSDSLSTQSKNDIVNNDYEEGADE